MVGEKELVDDIHSMWGAEYFLDRAQKLVKNVMNELAEYNTAEVAVTGVALSKKKRRHKDDSVNR